MQQLPASEQDAIAQLILDELADEQQWHQAFERSQDALNRLAAQVRADIRAGKVKPLGMDKMITLLIALALIAAGATIYVASVSREFRKFLSGAFFVSGGIQLYLYFADVSVPLLGTDFVQTPGLSGVRSIPHFVFFLITLYFGFIKKPNE